MTNFSNRSSSGFSEPCCNGNTLCHFNGNLDDVVSVPVYVQTIYDAVQFNLQGMKTIQHQTFSPAIPCGYTVSRIADIRTRAFFNPCNIDDPRNLRAEMDTTLSGATFVQDCHGNPVTVIGPDGLTSQKILYPDNTCCDEDCMGTPVFGTQNVKISGNIIVYIDLILCNNCNHETRFTVCAEIPVATESRPMCLTNFFEICIPASTEHAFLPRFTELNSISSEVRLATNNCGRDLTINSNGELSGNLIVSVCVNAEKTVVAPVQMCVLSTGMADVPAQTNSGCNGFPAMFASGITTADTEEGCGCGDHRHNRTFDRDNDCGCNDGHHHDRHDDCGCGTTFGLNSGFGFTSHHSSHNDCGCGMGHDRDRDRDDNCGCNDGHHHDRHDDCGCTTGHHHDRHDDCGCTTGHDRDRDRDDDCDCNSRSHR